MLKNLHWLQDNNLASFLYAPDDGGGSGGGGKGEEDDETDDDEEDDDDPPKSKGKTFSQSQLNRFLAREKTEGKKAGKREVLEALGVKDLEEAQQILKKHRDSQDESKSEAEREAAKAKRDADEAAAAKREATRERVEARIERQLMKAKVKEGKEDKVAKLLEVDRDADPSVDDIKAAIEDLQEDFPELFTSSSKDDEEDDDDETPKGRTNRPSRVGDPGRPPRREQKKDAASKARSRLEERHGRKLQKQDKS